MLLSGVNGFGGFPHVLASFPGEEMDVGFWCFFLFLFSVNQELVLFVFYNSLKHSKLSAVRCGLFMWAEISVYCSPRWWKLLMQADF